MWKPAISSQHRAHEPAPYTRLSRPTRLTQARSIDRTRPETWRTTCDAIAHKHIRTQGTRRPASHVLRGDPQADDRGRADDDGGFAGRTSWWAMARGAPQPIDRGPSGRLLRLLASPLERTSQGSCPITVRAG